VNRDDVISGCYVGVVHDIKTVDYGSILVTAEDVAIFLRTLNNGSLFDKGEHSI